MRFAFISILVLGTAALDLGLYVCRGPDSTISAHFRTWCEQWPIVPFLLGMLAGHLLWPLRP
jgi:hypothetical protein